MTHKFRKILLEAESPNVHRLAGISDKIASNQLR